MRTASIFLYIWRNLTKNIFVFLSNILAIFLGVVLVAFLFAVSFGAERYLKKKLGELPDIRSVYIFYDPASMQTPISAEDRAQILSEHKPVYHTGINSFQAIIYWKELREDNLYYIQLEGAQPDDPILDFYQTVKGRKRINRGSWEIVLPEKCALELNPMAPYSLVGKKLTLVVRRYPLASGLSDSAQRVYEEKQFPMTVIGIVNWTPESVCYCSLEVAQWGQDWTFPKYNEKLAPYDEAIDASLFLTGKNNRDPIEFMAAKATVQDKSLAIQEKKSPIVLSVQDLIKPEIFIERLSNIKEALSWYLHEMLSDDLKKILASRKQGERLPPSVLEKMIGELNLLLAQACIYDKERFSHVRLSSDIQNAIQQKPSGEQLLLLNRRLLEAGYPGEIRKREQKKVGVRFLGLDSTDPARQKLKILQQRGNAHPHWQAVVPQAIATQIAAKPENAAGSLLRIELQRAMTVFNEKDRSQSRLMQKHQIKLKISAVAAQTPNNAIIISRPLARWCRDWEQNQLAYLPPSGRPFTPKISTEFKNRKMRLDFSSMYEAERHAQKIRMHCRSKYHVTWTGEKDFQTIKQVEVYAVLFIMSVGVVTLLAGSISIGNTLYAMVLRHTNEIGILRALGVEGKYIFRIFISQAVGIGLLAGVFGLIFSHITFGILNQVLQTRFELEVGVFYLPYLVYPLIILAAIAICVLAGLLPCMKALRMTAMDAIRSYNK